MSELDKLIEAVEAGGMIHMTDLRRAITNGADRVDFHKARDGSLDAALALHEALLPGWHWDGYSRDGFVVWGGAKVGQTYTGEGAIPARAWLLAILRAYRSMQA